MPRLIFQCVRSSSATRLRFNALVAVVVQLTSALSTPEFGVHRISRWAPAHGSKPDASAFRLKKRTPVFARDKTLDGDFVERIASQSKQAIAIADGTPFWTGQQESIRLDAKMNQEPKSIYMAQHFTENAPPTLRLFG